MAQQTNVGVIKEYFEADPHGRKIDMAELKALSGEERAELAKLAAGQLGYKQVGDKWEK